MPILSSQVNFNTWNDYTEKYIVLAYDATETLIAASSTDLDNGAFTVLVEDGTTITRIEIRDVMNTLIEAVNGTWPQVLNPEIILSSNALDPLYNVSGQPSDEHGYGSYTVSGQDLTENIIVVAPTHFEIAVDIAGPWESDLSLAPTFNNTIYVRLNSEVVGEHSGDITHNSTGAAQVSVRVEGETLAPEGEIIVNSTMTPFYQEVGTPSVAQSYSLSSNDLSGDITITTSTPFELSSDAGTNWASSIAVSHAFNGLIYVRMNSAEVGTFENIVIEHSNPNTSPVSITVSGTATPAFGPVHNLFFSEYIEGSSNNKAIEIYNASGQSVDLSRYQVELYRNGAATPGNTLIMSGILAAGEVYVIANSEAITGIQDQADVFSTVTYFNGDDALALRCLNPDTLIDVIGTIGTDPGDGWAVAGVADATQNHTLVRKPTVATGSTDWASQQGTDEASSQWIVSASDTITDLGTHTIIGGTPESPIVTITRSGDNVLLAWPDVDGAAQYRIESSDDPYTGYTTLGTTNSITYSTPASTAKKFFRVIALP
ncbi:Lamin Tail Domain protein [anaerobic digester metagenome]